MQKKRIDGVKWLVILILCLLCNIGFTYPDNLWKGLIGEAVSEGYEGMYAVCYVYKNRIQKGMSLGCVALKKEDLDEFVRRQGKRYETMAKDIVRKVFEESGEDVTFGATHYENVETFGVPYWTKDMIVTVKIGRHTFYRERR